jgi:hypothetical protein
MGLEGPYVGVPRGALGVVAGTGWGTGRRCGGWRRRFDLRTLSARISAAPLGVRPGGGRW